MLPEFGTLCLSLDHGLMQVYSHHNQGGFIDSFNASHLAGDCVVSCATDRENRYLFTGTVLGYVKTWLVKNYWYTTYKQIVAFYSIAAPIFFLLLFFSRQRTR